MKRSLFGLLLLGFVPTLMAGVVPKNSIIIEKVDPTRFPKIDVHFTVIDNVAGTEFYDLEANAGSYTLTVKEKKITPTETSYQLVADAEVKDSQNRSMATCLTVDRSGSMSDVLQHVKKACVSFVKSIPDSDKTAVLFFQGGSGYDGMYFHQAVGNDQEAALEEFCNKYGSSSGGMTPMFDAWELSITSIDTFATSMDTLCVVCLTDGINTSSTERPNSIITLGNSYRMPIYNIAFPKMYKDDNDVVHLSDNVDDALMLKISSKTDAAYFEPVPPYPIVPDMPAYASGQPDGIDDVAIEPYFVDMMILLQRLIKEDDDAEFDTFKSYIQTYISSPAAEDFDADYFENLEIDNGKLNQVAIQSLQHGDLTTQTAVVTQEILNTVSEEDIEKFYNDQMFTMFNKIRNSKKRLYRMTYETPHQRLDGSIRDVEIAISFTTYDKFQLQDVYLTGKSNARYAAPIVAEEDHKSLGETTVDTSDPLYGMLLASDPPPRQGSWAGEPMEIKYTIDLMGRYEADGEPLKIATLKNDGTVELSSDSPADNPFMDVVAQKDAESLLLPQVLNVTESGGLVKTDFYAFTPTCIPEDPADPAATFPKGNPFAHEFRKKPLWYQVTPTLKKKYKYTRKYTYVRPDDTIQVFTLPDWTGYVQLTLPPIITYVYDKTPPSITVWACPDREIINRVTLAEGEIHKSADGTSLESTDLDSEAAVRPFTLIVDGDYWDPTLRSNLSIEPAKTSSSCLMRTTWPLQLESGKELEGLFVREDERLMMKILVRDNFDLNQDFEWTLDPANNPAAHNDFQNTDRFEAKEGDEHFLLNLTKKYGSDDSHWTGFSTWEDRLSGYIPVLETEGVAEPKVVDAELVLRDPNYAGGTGPKRHLVIKAFDKSGNQSMIEIPINILPVDFDATKLGSSGRKK